MSSFFLFFLLHPFLTSLSAACGAEIIWRSKTPVMRSVKSGHVQWLSDGREGEEGMFYGACIEGVIKERRRDG